MKRLNQALSSVRALLGESAFPNKKFGEYTLTAVADPGKNEWAVEAYFGNWRKAGEAEFVAVYEFEDPKTGEPHPPGGKRIALKGWNVEVGSDHRRKGLASAMYDYAEEVFGLPVKPGDVQTPDGKAFLKKRTAKK